ncbi:uncharacterized protein DNG_03395 [Cephalotrichum gorgonifer]|uniref:25S rRNA (uridine-N(3))-methyltransferase BMT5-like domain-containing protein n=1 Tax=Cephalotrichum gorgonifer TaxID=2041049 RepID=A0AAE8MW49_9PEZI|nr:uncharacterized protein DNG_03395 [Cephalotrichum gorgonifer]
MSKKATKRKANIEARRKGPNTHKTKPPRGSGAKAKYQPPPVDKSKKPAKKTGPPPPLPPPTMPFAPTHRILLVGEGDLSFAASLVSHHACTSVTATVLEPSKDALLEKYPHADAHIDVLEAAAPECKVLYGVDATKMPAYTIGRAGSKRGLMDRIMFNFPHVGGKSTDVNRQVRYNQELLVSFFGRAEPSLARGGAIVVTIFEGQPYELWNIRDLGRHCGFQVERSFRFRADAYPGYKHARTLGVVRNKKGDTGGGWRGETRPARSYVFVRKGEVSQTPVAPKRKRGEDSDSDDAEDSDDYPDPSDDNSDA